MVHYVDPSALVGVYLDEPHARPLREQLMRGEPPMVTSELSRLEIASAVLAGARAKRIRRPEVVLEHFEADSSADGTVGLLDLVPEETLPAARQLMLEHPLRTLDAIHLAVALEEAETQELVFVTRDRAQATVARRLGLSVE